MRKEVTVESVKQRGREPERGKVVCHCLLNPPHFPDFFFPFLTSPSPKHKVLPSSSSSSSSHHLSVARHCFKSVPFHCPCLSCCLFVTVCVSHSLINFGISLPSEVPQIFSMPRKDLGKKRIVMEDTEGACHSCVAERDTNVV